MRRWKPMLSLLLLVACGSAERADEAERKNALASEPFPSVVGEAENRALAALCDRAWELELATNPVGATYLGEHRFDGDLVLPTPESEQWLKRRTAELLAELERLDRWSLGERDRTTWDFLRDLWSTRIESFALSADEASWNLDPRSGPQIDFLSLADVQPAATDVERQRLLTRWRLMGAYVDQCTANLERGLASGRVASRAIVERVLAQVEEIVATAPEDSTLYSPASRPENQVPERAAWRADLADVIRVRILPAFLRYRDVLRDRVLPRARSNDQPGILHVAGGDKAYTAAIRRHTSLTLPPEEIHAFGLAEVSRIRDEIRELGRAVFGTADFSAIQAKLRTDPELHFRTRDEVEAKARLALHKANLAVPSVFGLLPRTPCVVVRVPDFEERDTTIGYYREPAADGSRPGRYYINTYAPETRPRYDAEVLAFHEAVPGHHLQIALAQELRGLPMLRRHTGVNVYAEGWALYTERLCDELKLYSTDLDRLGMLSFDAWRASRLVVDTGIHAFGWTRDQAIAYLKDNTLLAENNVVNEVDRYIAWPGQALGYKLGQREILALRAEAEQRLGARFRLAAFHDRVLGQGALPLPILRERVESWIAVEERAAAAASNP
jgi:uncharacterized protein (DUF885 family)